MMMNNYIVQGYSNEGIEANLNVFWSTSFLNKYNVNKSRNVKLISNGGKKTMRWVLQVISYSSQKNFILLCVF